LPPLLSSWRRRRSALTAKLPAELADDLNPYVRDKYLELWRAAQVQDRE